MRITAVLNSKEYPEGRVERVLWSDGHRSWRAVAKCSDGTERSSNERTRVEAERSMRGIHKFN